ncbi:MAG: type I-U CRISPR-associated helicase/endonuclease Cas3 [Acidimicrobiaceae bacterium]|nr:type I-U CRISPR-associated helicase/endonuclease Cas3 [Acidimicrobiaceae bacterium]
MNSHSQQLSEMPEFKDFYKAINDRDPFPWQRRLAEQVSTDAAWPLEIGVPTGLGKTACLDISVWWLASQAHLHPSQRSAPTRIWWVVNRRLLVDEASRHAEKIQAMLRDPTSGRMGTDVDVLHRVAARLESLAGTAVEEPLCVIPLRGGINLQRPPHPAQPSVIVSTIPMYGSRLLFRGYGSSRSMRPIDAALAGTDSLVLVDEAHLASHLRELIPKLQQCMHPRIETLPKKRESPQVVSLTATGDASSGTRFDLDEADYAHQGICNRLDAAKPVEIDSEPTGDTAKALCDSAAKLLPHADAPASLVIFSNTPALARKVFTLLRGHKECADADLLLVTGRTRQADSDELRRRLLSPEEGVPANAPEQLKRSRHLVVVSTQTLEVGADLDFEYLVTEQCGVRALTQRLGRLNRLGRHRHARAVYLHRPPRRSESKNRDRDGNTQSDGWPVYGTEPEVVLERLAGAEADGKVHLSPRVIAERLGEPADDPGRAPEVLPDLVWEWIKTTTPPHGEAPVEPYFSGIRETLPTVSVLWRIYIPATEAPHEESAENADEQDDETSALSHLWPRVRPDETIELPLYELRSALKATDIDQVHRIVDGGRVELAQPSGLRPGDAVILPSDAGMCDEFGWNPESRDRVVDLSLKRSGLPLDRQALGTLCGGSSRKLDAQLSASLLAAIGDGEQEFDEVRAQEASERLIALLRERDLLGFEPDARDEFLDTLNPTPVRALNEVPRLEVSATGQSASLDESDEISLCETLPPQAMELVAHGAAVGDRAKGLASALGLSEELTGVIAQAGDFHDLGKADARFQRWLDPDASADADRVLLAKSQMPKSRWQTARSDAGWPRGGRHEDLSARLVKAWIQEDGSALANDDQDLLLHLVISHHGKGRPLLAPVADGSPDTVQWTFDGGVDVSVAVDLSLPDWEQPARFRRLNERFGPWGLALLEALVRQADHQVSAATEVQ